MLVHALLAATLTATPAALAQVADPPEPAPAEALTPLAVESALAMRPLSHAELDWLRPRRSRLPQNPYAHTDFTAYTLEWGEAKVGLNRLTVGVLPRTELATAPLLDGLGIKNGSAKVNLVRLGPLDLAAEASHHRLTLGEFVGFQTNLGGAASLRILDPWSLHVGGSWSMLGADGLPDLAELSPAITWFTGENVRDYDISEMADGYEFHLRARTLSARVATDVRVNRRDSIILQGQAHLWGAMLTDVDVELPPILGLDEVLKQNESGTVAIRDSYVASIAYHVAWRRAELRVGVGASSLPGAWLLQSTDFSYRFGGKTRLMESRIRQGWRRNRRALQATQVRAPTT